ncbi:YihY/virulence factor BrkB family protein [Ruminococcaceae bacterium OttesenSCG-928-I18]|nr:YihY/virulence factor BrkB family protein [Ruminococcaceae bacterium OttesenSCG-928-I18]
MNKEKLLRFAKIVISRYNTSELTSTSVIIAYYVLLALFPLLILFGNLLPLLHIDPDTVIVYIETLLPEAVLPIMEPIIFNLLTSASGGLLSLSTVALIWSASKGISYMQNGMNKAYGIKAGTSYVARRIISMACMLLIVLLVGSFLVVFSFGDAVLAYISPAVEWAGPLRQTMRSVRWPVTVFFLLCMLTIVYVIAPAVKVRIREALPGAALAAAGLLLLVQLFALYVRFSTRSLSSYGTLSSFFVLMIWLNFSAMIVVAGAVLNASVHEYRFGKASENQNVIDSLFEEKVVPKVKKRFFSKWGKKSKTKKGDEEHREP